MQHASLQGVLNEMAAQILDQRSSVCAGCTVSAQQPWHELDTQLAEESAHIHTKAAKSMHDMQHDSGLT